MNRASILVSSLILTGFVVACNQVSVLRITSSASPALFRVRVGPEQFVMGVTDPRTIKDAMDSISGDRRLIPIGTLARGDGGFNTGYRWHLIPDSVRMADLTIELCDGLPSGVEGDLDYWLGTVKQFCPWQARVTERLDTARTSSSLAPSLPTQLLAIQTRALNKTSVATTIQCNSDAFLPMDAESSNTMDAHLCPGS